MLISSCPPCEMKAVWGIVMDTLDISYSVNAGL